MSKNGYRLGEKMREQHAKKLLESSYNDLAINKSKLDIQKLQLLLPLLPSQQQQQLE